MSAVATISKLNGLSPGYAIMVLLAYAIVAALNEAGREVKAHIIQRALLKSPFVARAGEANLDGETHSLWVFSTD